MNVESKRVVSLSATERIAMLKALADETRLKIAAALLEAPHCTEELATRLKRAPATISFHLRKLDEAGLVVKRKTQYYLMYALRHELLETTIAALISPDTGTERVEQRRLEKDRHKVLQTFFKDGRLVKIPKQWRKRRIVLEQILYAFEAGREYDEAELNQRIHAFNDDHCLIRRLLVDERLMMRNGQKYCRICEEKDDMTHVLSEYDSRKETKRAYLEAPKEAGIFRITNRENGRVYLGSSLNLHGPLNKHQFVLSMGSHMNKALQKDWQKFGADAFVFEIVDTVSPADEPGFHMENELSRLEDIWIKKEKIFTAPERAYNRRKKIRE